MPSYLDPCTGEESANITDREVTLDLRVTFASDDEHDLEMRAQIIAELREALETISTKLGHEFTATWGGMHGEGRDLPMTLPPRAFVVTYIGDNGESAETVSARTKEQAKRRLREQVPTAHIVHVELQQEPAPSEKV